MINSSLEQIEERVSYQLRNGMAKNLLSACIGTQKLLTKKNKTNKKQKQNNKKEKEKHKKTQQKQNQAKSLTICFLFSLINLAIATNA